MISVAKLFHSALQASLFWAPDSNW